MVVLVIVTPSVTQRSNGLVGRCRDNSGGSRVIVQQDFQIFLGLVTLCRTALKYKIDLSGSDVGAFWIWYRNLPSLQSIDRHSSMWRTTQRDPFNTR